MRKVSIGVAVCRRNPVTLVPELMLVRARTTYDFNSFVFGKFRPWDYIKIQHRLDNTSIHEKVLLMSCDFSRLWYHIWLRVPTADDPDEPFYQFYINCRNKFEKFVSKDGGRRFRYSIARASSVEPGWAIPRGHQNTGETEIECAVREVEEETGVAASDYTIMYDVKPIASSYDDESTTYICKYYIAAIADESRRLAISFLSPTQISEISGIGWYGLREIRGLIGQNHNLLDQSRLALKLFKHRQSRCRMEHIEPVLSTGSS